MKRIVTYFLCVMVFVSLFTVKVRADVLHVDMMGETYLQQISKKYEDVLAARLKERLEKALKAKEEAAAKEAVKAAVKTQEKTKDTQVDKQPDIELKAAAKAAAGSYSQSDIELLYKICHAESRGEGERGQMAVANVIVNRVKSSKFPNSISGVVYQSGQFSPTRDKSFASIQPSAQVKASVNKVIAGQRVFSDRVLYFKSTNSSAKWGKYKLVATIGKQMFYEG